MGAKNKMVDKIAVIRIAGQVNLRDETKETLKRLRLKKKYTCLIIPGDHDELLGMIKNVKDRVAFGRINEETLKKLEEARGNTKTQNKTKTLSVYRLHPPRGGIETKHHFPKGVLGNNKEEINKLIERML